MQAEGKFVLYQSHTADITKQTFSGSAFPHGIIIMAVVGKINVSASSSSNKRTNVTHDHVRSVQVFSIMSAYKN